MYDVNFGTTKEDDIILDVLNFKPVMVGLSNPIELGQSSVIHFAKRLKLAGYNGIVFVGGLAVSLNVEDYLNGNSMIDFAIKGEGEKPLLQIASMENDINWNHVRGVVYINESGNIVDNGYAEIIEEIDQIPFPARDFLFQYKQQLGDKATASLIQSRGCFKHCIFCCTQSIYNQMCGKVYRRRSVDNIVKEIEAIYDSHGVKNFSFEDDQFILPGEDGLVELETFSKKINELPFVPSFRIAARIDTLTDEALNILDKCNVKWIFTGVETFNQEDLDYYGKEISVQQNIDGFRRLENNGWSAKAGAEKKIDCGFINFNPFSNITKLSNNLFWFKYFNIPFSMLTSKLEFYKGTDAMRDIEKLNPNYSKGTYFYDSNIANIYFCFSEYFFNENIRKIRKTFRNIEKLNLDNEDIVKKYRIKLDKDCFDVFEILLQMGEKRNSKNEMIEFIDNFVSNVYLEIEKTKIKSLMDNIQSQGYVIDMELR
jgi:hypothetical protein